MKNNPPAQPIAHPANIVPEVAPAVHVNTDDEASRRARGLPTHETTAPVVAAPVVVPEVIAPEAAPKVYAPNDPARFGKGGTGGGPNQ